MVSEAGSYGLRAERGLRSHKLMRVGVEIADKGEELIPISSGFEFASGLDVPMVCDLPAPDWP